MATTALTSVEVSYNFEKDRTIATDTEQLSTRADSKVEYANGTGANKITRIHSSRRTLTAASGTDDIDLTDLTDPAGDPINFATVRFFYLKNREPITGSNMRVGGAPINPWTDPFDGSATAKMLVKPGAELFVSAPIDGFTVITASRIMRIENVGGSTGDLDYDLVIGGEE